MVTTYKIVIVWSVISFNYESLEREDSTDDEGEKYSTQDQERYNRELSDDSFPLGKIVLYSASIVHELFLILVLRSVDL